MENKTRLIDKVKALLSKTESNGATKQEAISALEKAESLMKKHNIARHELLGESKYSIGWVEINCKLSNPDKNLLGSISFLFDCKFIWNDDKAKFYGYKEDAELASFMYQQVRNIMIRSLQWYKKSEMYLNDKANGKSPRALNNGFRKGFLIAVNNRIVDMYQARTNDSFENPSYAVVLSSKVQKIDIAFERASRTKRNSSDVYKSSRPKVDKDAYNAGKKVGKDVKLQQGLKDEH